MMESKLESYTGPAKFKKQLHQRYIKSLSGISHAHKKLPLDPYYTDHSSLQIGSNHPSYENDCLGGGGKIANHRQKLRFCGSSDSLVVEGFGDVEIDSPGLDEVFFEPRYDIIRSNCKVFFVHQVPPLDLSCITSCPSVCGTFDSSVEIGSDLPCKTSKHELPSLQSLQCHSPQFSSLQSKLPVCSLLKDTGVCSFVMSSSCDNSVSDSVNGLSRPISSTHVFTYPSSQSLINVSLNNNFDTSLPFLLQSLQRNTHERIYSSQLAGYANKRSLSESDTVFLCHVCGHEFSTYDILSKHVSKHIQKESAQTGKDAKGHLCDICQRSFARSDMLTRHSRLHTGVKPYVCEQCGQVFSRSDHLSTHSRTHTGEKPYQCSHCPYAACRRDMITRHMRTHTKQVPRNWQAPRTVLDCKQVDAVTSSVSSTAGCSQSKSDVSSPRDSDRAIQLSGSDNVSSPIDSDRAIHHPAIRIR